MNGKIEGINLPETAVDFGSKYLKVNYIFWSTQEPYYSKQLIPLLQGQK